MFSPSNRVVALVVLSTSMAACAVDPSGLSAVEGDADEADSSGAGLALSDHCRLIRQVAGEPTDDMGYVLGSVTKSSNPYTPWGNSSHRMSGAKFAASNPALYGKANKYSIYALASDVNLYAYSDDTFGHQGSPTMVATCAKGTKCEGAFPAGFAPKSFTCQREFASKQSAVPTCQPSDALCQAANAVLPMNNPIISTKQFVSAVSAMVSESIPTTPFWESGLQGVHEANLLSTNLLWTNGSVTCSGSECTQPFEVYNDVLEVRVRMEIELNAALGTWYDAWIHVYMRPILDNGVLKFHWVKNDVKVKSRGLIGPANHSAAIRDSIDAALDQLDLQATIQNRVELEAGKQLCGAVAAYCSTGSSGCDLAKSFCPNPTTTSETELRKASKFVLGGKQRLQFSLASGIPSSATLLPVKVTTASTGQVKTLQSARFTSYPFINTDVILNDSRN